jgi:hypothetical protein
MIEIKGCTWCENVNECDDECDDGEKGRERSVMNGRLRIEVKRDIQ